MKKNLLFVGCLFFISGIYSQGINFEQGSWAEIKAKAKEQKKIIFLDAYTSWCGPCKAMAKSIFTNPDVASYYNSNFINAKIDMEKGEGPAIAKEYEVNCYPNLLYINGDGFLVHRSAGYRDSTEFVALGKTSQNTGKTFSEMNNSYNNGNTSPRFISEYLQLLSNSCLPANEVAVKYFGTVKENEMATAENWGIIRDYVEDIHSSPFNYLVKNRNAFAQKYSGDSVNSKIFDSYLNHGYKLIFGEKFDSAAVINFKKEVDNIPFERANELKLSLDLPFAEKTGSWDNYFLTAGSLIEKFKMNDFDFLNNVSYTIYEKSDNKSHLAGAELWAKKSVEISEGPYNLDTYACLLFKNGKKEEAIKTEKKAIELLKASGQDTKDFEEMILKFEGKK